MLYDWVQQQIKIPNKTFYEENKKNLEIIAGFVNPSSKVSGFAEAIIAGYKSDVTHIINGSRSSVSGHSWEVFSME